MLPALQQTAWPLEATIQTNDMYFDINQASYSKSLAHCQQLKRDFMEIFYSGTKKEKQDLWVLRYLPVDFDHRLIDL